MHLSDAARGTLILVDTDIVFALIFDVLIDRDAPIDEVLLGQHRLEDLLSVVQINTVEVLCLDFLFSLDFNSVEHSELGDVIENLAPVVLLVLDWIEAEVELCEEAEALDELQLQHLDDVVEGEVEEAKRFDVLKTSEVLNMVLREVQLFQEGQLAQAGHSSDLVVRQIELF